MIYNLYIFNRKGKCLYYKEWSRPVHTLSDDPEEDKRLMFGMLFSIKDLVSKLSPRPSADGLHTLRTNSYTLHHYESVSGIRFVLNTDASVSDLYSNLLYIYSNIYVEYVVRNPLYRDKPDEPITCSLFESRLEEYISSLPFFSEKLTTTTMRT